METSYTIKNFRVFDKKGVTVEIAPLTFLVGCNSSGKSSIVKSLSLLKTFFQHKFNHDDPVIGAEIDFSVKPIDSLGAFRKVVRSSSKEKSVTLEYNVHSRYIDNDVTVSITLGDGELGNAKVTGISIAKSGITLIAADENKYTPDGDFCSILDAFKKYLTAIIFRSQVKAKRGNVPLFIPLDNEEYNEYFETEYRNALKNCDENYLMAVLEDSDIKPVKLDDIAARAFDKFSETGIMSYFPIFDEMDGMSDVDEIREFLRSKVKDNDLKEAMFKAIDIVCEDYIKEKAADFLNYYRSKERSIFSPREINLYDIIKGGVNVSNLITWNSPYSTDRIYVLKERANDEPLRKTAEFALIHDMIFHLSDTNPYSYIVKGEFGEESLTHTVHPLYDTAFAEYIRLFLEEVISTDVTEGIDYVSSSRIQVRRMYPMDDRNEFSEAVKRYFSTKTKFMTLDPPLTFNVDKDMNGKIEVVKVSDFMPGNFMDKWLRAFGIGHRMSLEMDSNGLGLLLKVYRTESDKKGILLADMGYGITQLFSILLQIEEMIMASLYGKFRNYSKPITGEGKRNGMALLGRVPDASLKPRTLAIEEPEIHLHPKYQSLLAEMFLEAYKDYNIQFIIETHSEYLLRKIQTLIGIKKLTPDEVSMTYVEDDSEVMKGAEKVRRIPVKEDGRLTAPFGPGFYDEADNLSLQLFTNMGK